MLATVAIDALDTQLGASQVDGCRQKYLPLVASATKSLMQNLPKPYISTQCRPTTWDYNQGVLPLDQLLNG
jgi:hypothetical protein